MGKSTYENSISIETIDNRLKAVYEKSKMHSYSDFISGNDPIYPIDESIHMISDEFLEDLFKDISKSLGYDFKQTELYDKMKQDKKEEEVRKKAYIDEWNRLLKIDDMRSIRADNVKQKILSNNQRQSADFNDSL